MDYLTDMEDMDMVNYDKEYDAEFFRQLDEYLQQEEMAHTEYLD